MTHLLVCVWRRKGPNGVWEQMAGPMSVYDGVQMEVNGRRTAMADSTTWEYLTSPTGVDPNHV